MLSTDERENEWKKARCKYEHDNWNWRQIKQMKKKRKTIKIAGVTMKSMTQHIALT